MSEDINAYLQKARDCLIDAEILLASNRNEAACNRAYYAVFDAILALLAITEDTYFKTHQGAHT